ncbi:hypothetical protein TDB9533_02498 [Thalassocella blandensis]|nr:hypothetical protein TDB9533_02498 [Thalassocella blandensis]
MHASIVQAVEDVTKFHLHMAKLLDTVSSKTIAFEEAQRFYKLSKYESIFYNLSMLAQQALNARIRIMEATSMEATSMEGVSKEEPSIEKPSNSHDPIMASDSLSPLTAHISEDVSALKNAEGWRQRVVQGQAQCAARYAAYMDTVTDAEVKLLLQDLIVQYETGVAK